MKFLCDVHISYQLVRFLSSVEYTAIHVNKILEGHTKDSTIGQYVDKNDFVLITKDQDFKNTFFINKSPKKLIKINLGNISNDELIDKFKDIIELIIKLNTHDRFIIEIDQFSNFYSVFDQEK